MEISGITRLLKRSIARMEAKQSSDSKNKQPGRETDAVADEPSSISASLFYTLNVAILSVLRLQFIKHRRQCNTNLMA